MDNQIQLFNTAAYQASEHKRVYDPAWDDTSSVVESIECVRAQVSTDTNKSAPEHIHWIEEYWVKRSGTKHYYYRYSWMVGRKKHRCHIPGGNVNSPLANYRKIDIEDLIALGESPDKIVEIINTKFK